LVMLVVDSSGSMEDLPACICPDPKDDDCEEGKPNCDLLNTFNEPPKSLAGKELKENRWAVTLESLTGKFKNFQCNRLPRTTLNGFNGYDEGYSIPYYQPWDCTTGERCDYPGPQIQETNGILDNYRDTLRFGLITFDGEYTYKGGDD